MFQRFNDGAL